MIRFSGLILYNEQALFNGAKDEEFDRRLNFTTEIANNYKWPFPKGTSDYNFSGACPLKNYDSRTDAFVYSIPHGVYNIVHGTKADCDKMNELYPQANAGYFEYPTKSKIPLVGNLLNVAMKPVKHTDKQMDKLAKQHFLKQQNYL
ncbi:MAG: hypothetical protein QE263_09020 [Vampirovibrionales bacterium]|nr:hypothetical protein [Vampirovibrionales bacterium]